MLLLAALFKLALFHLSVTVEQVLGSSFSNSEVAIHDQEQRILSKPSSYEIGANRTILVICRANPRGIPNIIGRPVDDLDLHVKCKGLRHKAHIQYFSTTNDDTPPVTTSRLILTPHVIKKNKLKITCYCIDVSATKERSPGLVISMKPEGHHSILSTSTHFKPKRNRIRTVTLRSIHKISWRFPNSSFVPKMRCFHDGQPLAVDQVIPREGKILVNINDALRKDAGFYYCRSKFGVLSSWLKLKVVGGWSKWHPWLACSTHCGPGKKIETRRCLETRFRLERCQGPSVRALPCFGRSCEVMVPQFTDEPADQMIRNGSSTNVTCVAQFGPSMFTMQMVCFSNDWKISYSMIQNETAVGSVSNNTVARITYKVELHRDRSGVALVYCPCFATVRQLTRRSRIAKISFPSDDGSYNTEAKPRNGINVHSSMASPASTTTAIRVEATRPASSSSSNSSFGYLAVGVVVFVAVFVSVLAVFLIRTRRKREHHNTECHEAVPVIIPPHEELHNRCETERVRHYEPPQTKIITLHSSVSSGDEDMLENRASNSPLLKCFLGEDSEPAEHYKLHPSEPMTEETDLETDESAFQRGESWKSNKSKVSAFSSVSAAFCPKPKLPDTVDSDLCAWGRFTEKGGRLTIEGTDVSLYIPANALPEQTSQVIYIGLMNSKGNYPKLSNQEALLSPVVVCGPDGLTFEKPVFLTVPHNAVLDKNNCWNPKVQSCSTVDEEEEENKWKVLEVPGGDAPLSHVSDKHMQIMVDHFTNFAVVGVASCSQETCAKLKSWIVAYYSEPKVNEDCITRVYCIPATDAAYKVLEGIESKLNGKMSDSQKLLQISNNNKNLQIKSKMICVGWSVVAGDKKSIPFNDIWQCTEQSPNVSFIFAPDSPQVLKFRSTFDARQEESDAGVEVLVSFCIQAPRRASSGYESQANGCQKDARYNIPIEIRRKLCHLLDPEDPFFNDWRRLAEKLGLGKVYINNLKGNTKIRSPTDEVIDLWEMTMSEKIPLSRIEEIFCEIERPDAVKMLQKITGLESTKEEPCCSFALAV